MNVEQHLRTLVDTTLNLGGRASAFQRDTALLGSVPELDSMGVVALLTAFEDQFGFAVEDDEIDGEVFQTWGSLLDFVQSKLQG